MSCDTMLHIIEVDDVLRLITKKLIPRKGAPFSTIVVGKDQLAFGFKSHLVLKRFIIATHLQHSDQLINAVLGKCRVRKTLYSFLIEKGQAKISIESVVRRKILGAANPEIIIKWGDVPEFVTLLRRFISNCKEEERLIKTNEEHLRCLTDNNLVHKNCSMVLNENTKQPTTISDTCNQPE